MRRFKHFAVIALLLILSNPSGAFSLWRHSVSSLWPQKTLEIDGRSNEWSDWPLIETDGLSIRAMNDADNLYLLLTGANDDGRVILSGSYQQTLTLWFLGPDQETKVWGMAFNFNNAHAAGQVMVNGRMRNPEAIRLTDIGVDAVGLEQEGVNVSSITLPGEINVQTDLSTAYARQPIYEFRIPLHLLKLKGRETFLHLHCTAINTETKMILTPDTMDAREAANGSRRDRSQNQTTQGRSATIRELNLPLMIRLAKPPKS